MLKSQIPWTNYCLRKYGGNIQREIVTMGVEQAFQMKKYQAIQHLKDNAPVWISTEVMSDKK